MKGVKIGFVGLGIMGNPMAGHLIRAGYDVRVYDVNPAAMGPTVGLGAIPATSCLDVSRDVDFVISMVPDSPDVEVAYLGEAGVLAGVRKGTVLVDMSTISPGTAVRVADAAHKAGAAMLDAPVSGGETGARQASLSIMVGGEREVFDRAESLLRVLGTPTYCGKNGAGQVVKACNQIQVALNFLGMAEALVLGMKAGVDPALVLKVLSSGYAQTKVMDVRGPKVLAGDFSPGFRSRLHYKDLNIISEAARTYGCCLPASALARELFGAMQANGWGDLDHSAVIKVIELLSKVESRGP